MGRPEMKVTERPIHRPTRNEWNFWHRRSRSYIGPPGGQPTQKHTESVVVTCCGGLSAGQSILVKTSRMTFLACLRGVVLCSRWSQSAFFGDVFDNTGKVEEIHWRQVSWVQMDAHNPTIEVLFWRKIG